MSTTHTTDASLLPLVLHLGPAFKRMTDREFSELCSLNRDLRIELTADGDLIITPPTGGETGRRNFDLTAVFGAWVERDGTGVGFDSSTAFTLPNGAKRSPDLAWASRSRWDALSEDEREEIPPLCPDFVLELRSRNDSPARLRAKMREYIANGSRLGWLIDRFNRQVWVYTKTADGACDERCLDDPATVAGDPVLPGFTLELARIW